MSDSEGGGDDALGGVETAAPPAGKSKMVPILLVLNVALMGAVGFFVLKKPAAPHAKGGEAAAEGEHKEEAGKEEHAKDDKDDKEEKEPEESKGGSKPGPMYELDPFVIQLHAAETERYVRISFKLELNRDSDVDKLKDRVAQMRDEVIVFFSDRTLDELRGSDGLKRMKEALLRRFEEIVPGRRIRNIYITDFVMQ